MTHFSPPRIAAHHGMLGAIAIDVMTYSVVCVCVCVCVCVQPPIPSIGREWGVACASYSLCNLKGLSCYLLVVPPVLAECTTGDRVPAGICRAHMGEDA